MGPLPPVGRCRGGRPAAARVLAVTVLLSCWLGPAPARAETALAAPVEPLDADESYLVLARLQAGQPVAVGDLHRALHSSQLTLRARAAAALGECGVDGSVPYLVDALSDLSSHVGAEYTTPGMETTRYWANRSLVELTGQDLGFVWDGPAAERAEAVRRWREWYREAGAARAAKRIAPTLLFGTLVEELAELAELAPSEWPAEVRPRAEEAAVRWRAFGSRLPPERLPPGPQAALADKRRRLERDIVALVPAGGVGGIAAAYARTAVLAYEWEGMADGPLAEAAGARAYLDAAPDTPLRPYLLLFLAHRYRCAAEATGRSDGEAFLVAWRYYRDALATALHHPDPLTRYVAADVDRRPFLYLDAPRPLPMATGPPCPGATSPGPAEWPLVADPWTWALECFAVSAGEEAGRRDSLAEVELDLDGDGARELLLGSTVDRGNAGGAFYVLRREGASYRPVGTLFLHPRAFAVVQRPGEQRPAMWRYLRLGAGSGRLESLVLDGSTFTVTSAEEVEPFGRGRGRLCALFGQLFCGSGELDKPAAEPVSSLADAVAVAERYVAENDLDPTGQYLHSVQQLFDERAGGSYWLAQWQWSAPRLGGELGLRVYPDGTVEEARLGP